VANWAICGISDVEFGKEVVSYFLVILMAAYQGDETVTSLAEATAGPPARLFLEDCRGLAYFDGLSLRFVPR